ncbi:hypothetical protein ABK040_011727 [Willaertia magna]
MVRENALKKRKTIVDHIFTEDILSEIIKYLDDLKDYLNLAQINKYFYELLLLKDNYLFSQFNEILFKKNLFLSKNLPNYIFKLKKLKILASNYLLRKFTNLNILICYTIVQQDLFKLTNLEKLSVNGNTYNIDSLSNLKNLKYLKLRNNKQLNDEWFKELFNLTKIDLFNCCNIYGKYFINFTKLKSLKLEMCENIMDTNFINFNNLEKVCIKNCPIITFNFLQNFTNLQKLIIEITENNINNINTYLNKLINLKILKLYAYKESLKNKEINITCFKNLTNLETLFIGFSVNQFLKVKDEHFKNLKNLKNLHLILEDNLELKGNFLKELTNLEILNCNVVFENNYYKYLTKLTKLEIKNNKKEITDENIIYLTNLKNLILKNLKINIKQNHLQKLLNNLNTINIDRSKLTGNYSLFKFTPNLTMLSAVTTNISDNDLIFLNKLKSLNISKCENINGECFFSLKNLIELNCSFCKNINFEYLINLPQLEKLEIQSTKVKDEDLNNLTNLCFLNVCNCDNLLSGEFLLRMNNLKGLELEGLSFQEELTEKEIEDVKRKIKEGIVLSEIREEFAKEI